MNELQKLSQELKDAQRLKEIERSHGIHILDTSLIILTILLAIVCGALFVKLIT